MTSIPLVMMSANLRNPSPKWPRNLARFQAQDALFTARAPHLLATQEGSASQIAYLAARSLKHMVSLGPPADDTSVGLYYDPARLFCLAATTFSLPAHLTHMTRHYRRPRPAVWARFVDMTTFAKFEAVSLHLDADDANVARYWSQRFPEAFILSDTNSLPGSEVHQILTTGRRDTSAFSTDPQGTSTFHGFTGQGALQIDGIFAPRGDIVAHEVCRETPGGEFPSDHFPIIACIILDPFGGPGRSQVALWEGTGRGPLVAVA